MNITKELLLREIDDAILVASQKEATSVYKFMYQKSIKFLNNIKNIVLSEQQTSIDELKSQSLKLGMYSVKVVEPADLDYANQLGRVAYDFEAYYKILDK